MSAMISDAVRILLMRTANEGSKWSVARMGGIPHPGGCGLPTVPVPGRWSALRCTSCGDLSNRQLARPPGALSGGGQISSLQAPKSGLCFDSVRSQSALLNAAGSTRTVTSGCFLKADAWRFRVTWSFRSLATGSDVLAQVATIRIEAASKIVPIPIMIAWVG